MFRILTPDGQHVVALIADRRPPDARVLERALVRAAGSLPFVLDAGAVDALHAHRDAHAPPPLPPGAVVRLERRRAAASDGLPLPFRPAGRPEPDPPPPDAAEPPDEQG